MSHRAHETVQLFDDMLFLAVTQFLREIVMMVVALALILVMRVVMLVAVMMAV